MGESGAGMDKKLPAQPRQKGFLAQITWTFCHKNFTNQEMYVRIMRTEVKMSGIRKA